ncbi:hypothetical protein BHM03_00025096 [Ensete ventricosum]|nr:hypothetical protein BHM03_00025096 [Ensete ventricosum]
MRKDSCNLEIDGSGGNMVIRGVATVVLQDYRGWTDRKERCCKFLEVTMLLEDGSRGNLDQVLLRDGGEMAVVGRKCWNRRQQQRVRWQKKVEGEAGEKGEITAGSIVAARDRCRQCCVAAMLAAIEGIRDGGSKEEKRGRRCKKNSV